MGKERNLDVDADRVDLIARLRAENERLRKALVKAREDLEDWLAYVPDYFREKHGADADLRQIDAALSATEGDGWRSMEDAPRDGAEIDVAWRLGDAKDVSVFSWDKDSQCWFDELDREYLPVGIELLGWKERPAPPTDAEQEDDYDS